MYQVSRIKKCDSSYLIWHRKKQKEQQQLFRATILYIYIYMYTHTSQLPYIWLNVAEYGWIIPIHNQKFLYLYLYLYLSIYPSMYIIHILIVCLVNLRWFPRSFWWRCCEVAACCCNSHQPDQLAPSMLFLAPAHIVDDEGNQKNQKGLGGATDVSWFSKAYKGIYIHI